MQLLIYGSKSFARTTAELARHCGHTIIGFVDDYEDSDAVVGDFTRASQLHPPETCGFVLAIGYQSLEGRWAAWRRVRAAGYILPSLVHPRAYVADSARIGQGCMVMAGAIVDVRAELGDAVVLWPGACVNHDSYIGDNSFLSPNSVVCGAAHVGANCFIGAGAAIADAREVPDHSFVKMQAVYAPKRR